MKKPSIFPKIECCILFLMISLLFLASPAGAFMEDVDREKPKPEFTRENDTITAKLIPRAKSNSITIDFNVSAGGKLESVGGFDIARALTPEINTKDFRSELFEIDINGVAPGGEAVLNMISAFFTSSTHFRVFNKNLQTPWRDSRAEIVPVAEKIQKFVVRIKDGGDLDTDGMVNGRIKVIGGPMDSFWGYVLGTLFIRFFGVFLVLVVLMIGMLVSGRMFQKFSKIPPQEPPAAKVTDRKPGAGLSDPQTDAISTEMAAAIGIALDLALGRTFPSKESFSRSPGAVLSNIWGQEGRRQIMADRKMVFNRIKK